MRNFIRIITEIYEKPKLNVCKLMSAASFAFSFIIARDSKFRFLVGIYVVKKTYAMGIIILEINGKIYNNKILENSKHSSVSNKYLKLLI